MDDDGDGALKPEPTSGSFSGAAMDLDFMDELLYDGCWLETADGFSFSEPIALTSTNSHQQSHKHKSS